MASFKKKKPLKVHISRSTAQSNAFCGKMMY